MRSPYRSTNWNPPAPVLDVRVGGPMGRADFFQPCEALLDSGADVTAIPVDLVQRLGLLPVSSVIVDRGGLPGDEEENLYAATVEVTLLGQRTIQVLQTMDPFALLGRDIINELRLVLDGPAGELEVRV